MRAAAALEDACNAVQCIKLEGGCCSWSGGGTPCQSSVRTSGRAPKRVAGAVRCNVLACAWRAQVAAQRQATLQEAALAELRAQAGHEAAGLRNQLERAQRELQHSRLEWEEKARQAELAAGFERRKREADGEILK